MEWNWQIDTVHVSVSVPTDWEHGVCEACGGALRRLVERQVRPTYIRLSLPTYGPYRRLANFNLSWTFSRIIWHRRI